MPQKIIYMCFLEALHNTSQAKFQSTNINDSNTDQRGKHRNVSTNFLVWKFWKILVQKCAVSASVPRIPQNFLQQEINGILESVTL